MQMPLGMLLAHMAHACLMHTTHAHRPDVHASCSSTPNPWSQNSKPKTYPIAIHPIHPIHPTSSTSALPHRLDTDLLPCFATLAPAAAARMDAPVEMLTLPIPSPPVPTMSTTARVRMTTVLNDQERHVCCRGAVGWNCQHALAPGKCMRCRGVCAMATVEQGHPLKPHVGSYKPCDIWYIVSICAHGWQSLELCD